MFNTTKVYPTARITEQVLYAGEGELGKDGDSGILCPPGSEHRGSLGGVAPGDVLVYKNHQMMSISFHMPTSCSICPKQLSAVVRPPPALECQSTPHPLLRSQFFLAQPGPLAACHIKIHKSHLDLKDKDVSPCTGLPLSISTLLSIDTWPAPVNYDPMVAKDLLIMTESSRKCDAWIKAVKSGLPKGAPPRLGLDQKGEGRGG